MMDGNQRAGEAPALQQTLEPGLVGRPLRLPSGETAI